MSKIKNQLLPLILSVLILSFLTAYWIFAWDEPDLDPPLGNIATPINTGSTAQTKSGALTITKLTADSDSNDKIMLQGTQTAPHTIWLGNSKGVRFWDNINGELMLISNTGDVSISELINCDTIDTDASGKMVCGVDDTGAGSEDTLDTVADRGNTTDQAITIGSDLTISKSGGTDSDIIFPAQDNDPGYIKHYESSNTGIMYFSASDDKTTGDYFSFGSTPGDSYDEGARLTTSGNLQMDGDLIVDGNVGIGITSPLAKLHVVSDGNAAARFTGVGGVEFGIDMNSDVDRANFHTIAPSVNFHIDSKLGNSLYLNYYSGNNVYFGTGAGSATGIWKSDGKVGIGRTDPRTYTLLDVAGAVGVGRQGISGTYNSSQVQGIWSIGPNYKVNTDSSNDFGNQYGITYAHHNAGTLGDKKPIAGWQHQILFTSNGIRKAVISLSSGHAYFAGNIGIGTTEPKNKLDVEGGVVIGASYSGTYTAPSGGLLVQGNVGIGTASPSYKLDVAGNVGVNEYIYHNDDSNTYLRFLNDMIVGVAGGESLLYLVEGSQDYVKLGDGGDVDINLNNDVFVRGSDGNVGIGTTAPGAKLEVNGEIQAGSGGYADASFGVQRIYSKSTTKTTIWSHPKDSSFKVTWDGDDCFSGGRLCVCTGSLYADGELDGYSEIISPGKCNCNCGSSPERWNDTFFQLRLNSKGFMFLGCSTQLHSQIDGMIMYWY